MPRYKVHAEYVFPATYLIDAEDEDAARHLDGDIVEENEETHNCQLYDVKSVERVDDDEEDIT